MTEAGLFDSDIRLSTDLVHIAVKQFEELQRHE